MRGAAVCLGAGRPDWPGVAAWLGTMAVGSGLSLHSAGAWAGVPAVSTVNGKADARTGISNGTGVGLLSGSLSTPVGSSLGLQFDGAVGKREPQTASGTGNGVGWMG